MTPTNRLEAIEARLEKATPGPWGRMATGVLAIRRAESESEGGLIILAPDDSGIAGVWSDGHPECKETAALIAHAPADLAWAVARIRELEMALGGTTTRLQQACSYGAVGGKPDSIRLVDWRKQCALGWEALALRLDAGEMK